VSSYKEEGEIMCQATVYLARQGQANERIMEDVTRLEVVEGGVRIATFFEEPRVIPARVSHIDFLKHTVTLIADEKLEGK